MNDGMDIEDAVDDAISSLGLTGSVRRLSDAEVKVALSATAREFVEIPTSVWWWQSLVPDKPCMTYQAAGSGFQVIPRVCPDESTWLVVTDDRETGWSVYEASPTDIASILGECRAFEYFVASKSARWIVFENHHDMIIGMGDEVTGPIARLSAHG